MRCVHCGRGTGKAEAPLCSTCQLGIEKYPDQNPPIVTAYVRRGFDELEHLLDRHAAFADWLTIHNR